MRANAGSVSPALSIGLASAPAAFADDLVVDPSMPGPVQVAAGPTADNADPAALAACAQFAQVLDGSSAYYGDFADAFEGSSYADPAVGSSNVVGRTALREAASSVDERGEYPWLATRYRRTDADVVARRDETARQDGPAHLRRQPELHRNRNEQPGDQRSDGVRGGRDARLDPMKRFDLWGACAQLSRFRLRWRGRHGCTGTAEVGSR